MNRNKGFWARAGMACLEYGLVGAAALTASLYLFHSPFEPLNLAAPFKPIDVAAAAVPCLLLFLARTRQRYDTRLPRKGEAVTAAVAGTGFGFPLLAVGAFLLAASRGGYTGIEKWLPDVEDRAQREMRLIQVAVSDLELPQDVHHQSVELLEDARDAGVMANRATEDVLGAIVYVSARDEGDPRTMEEIAEALGTTKKRIGKAYRLLGRRTSVRVYPPEPEDYLRRFAEKLQLSETVQKQAKDLIEMAREKELLSGKSPKGIASAALFVAGKIEGDERTIKEVSDLLDVTTVTVRARSEELVRELDLDVEVGN